jgi:transglutaminase/protease-like cytokinesis protein 3
MNKKQNIIAVFLCSFLFLLASTLLINEPYVASAATASKVALNTTEAYLLKGEKLNLKVAGTSKKVTWSTNNKTVATVLSNGKITAIGHGTTYIKATVDNKTYQCKVTVINPSKITLKPTYNTVIVNGKAVEMNPISDIYSQAVLKKAGITYKVSGNSGVKVSSTGKVTSTKSGKFKVNAYIHGKKITTLDMEAVVYKGLSVSQIVLETNREEFISFSGDILPLLDDVTVTSSNSSMGDAEVSYYIELRSKFDRCDGIYIKTNEYDGTFTITVTVSGIAKELKVIVGDGLDKLSPVDAVKNNNFTGYSGKTLTALTAIRQFLDENNLFSSKLSDREKVTIIQKYLNSTYTGKITDSEYSGAISAQFLKGAGNCTSFTYTVCFLCECLEIDVYYCGGGAIVDGEIIGHAWNKVKVDGKWYYIDTAWNTGLTETLWSTHLLNQEGYFDNIFGNDEVMYKNCFD